MIDTQTGDGGKAAGIKALGRAIFLVQDPAPPLAHKFDMQRERPWTGTVVAAGPKAIEEGGVKPGSRIMFRKGTYQTKVFNGQEHLLLDPRDLESVIPPDMVVETPVILPDGVSVDNIRVPEDEQSSYMPASNETEYERLARAVTGKRNSEVFHFGENK